ncbi:MAG: nodulation protein NfeD [Ignavibacteriales bacterium]|nr:nodulation protein NfeD [Ignavibacteriales bacterium]
MLHRLFILSIFIIILPTVIFSQQVVLLKIDGAINPASSALIERGIERSAEKNAECLIIQLNTPGGLLTSTRIIVSAILESKIPIVVYVAPGGAHAGSAGVFITMAAHIAAMAPGTNIGAAHPVEMEGKMDSVMGEKVTNDAAAFIRTIAEKRNRNLKWAEDAVRKSQAITETEALDTNVIDLIAKNVDELLTQIDGKQVETITGTTTLHTKGARIEQMEMGWAEKLLDLLSNPNIALILFQLGTIGLILELYNPGSIFPGIVGVISLVLAFYSMHTLPINYAGLALIIFGIILFLLEIKIISHGMLAIGGAVSTFIGSIMLIRTSSVLEFVELSWSVIVASVLITTFFFVVILGLGIKAQRRKPTTGIEGLNGEMGDVIETLKPEGVVRIQGEIWNAESLSGTIQKGKRVRVVKINGLKLLVEPSTTSKE